MLRAISQTAFHNPSKNIYEMAARRKRALQKQLRDPRF